MAVKAVIIVRILNLLAATFMIVGAVAFILQGGFPSFILAVYCIIFGMMIVMFEFKLRDKIAKAAPFMLHFLGRAMFYIFIGCIILNYNPLSLACGIIVILIGVAFAICHFIPQMELPNNMQLSTDHESIQQQQQQQQQYPYTASPQQYNNSIGHSPFISNMSPSYSQSVAHPSPTIPPPQESMPYPQKTYISNESHIV
ncbi:COPI associated protein-domain-containing protein [Halteromyces radiatus]|uniref:COPI associated protein-domain-containing protein n=1 Tax=Halteromyces radiatus TaxID=101107 RepID=UPI002220A806|nr:COPI associated protein-domain-containing protein [Halteromyces radiatus]KAI8092928.1 COPI associated protein-domain-containing protein [Halteromyces radiatus]